MAKSTSSNFVSLYVQYCQSGAGAKTITSPSFGEPVVRLGNRAAVVLRLHFCLDVMTLSIRRCVADWINANNGFIIS